MAKGVALGKWMSLPIVAAVVALSAAAAPQDRGLLLRPATASERRLALVIGNDRYPEAPLRNARNDARAVATALGGLAFDVTLVEDATRSTFAEALSEFSEGLTDEDVVLFYFAGHGLAIDGENYLVPIDFRGDSPATVRLNGVRASEIQTLFERARLSVLILDACRNNPFSGMRAGGTGLAPMEARGSLIAFATGAGQMASDNEGAANGLFTAELLKVLEEPGLSIREVLFQVRRRVYAESNGRQFPAVYDGLLGDFVIHTAAAPEKRVKEVRPADNRVADVPVKPPVAPREGNAIDARRGTFPERSLQTFSLLARDRKTYVPFRLWPGAMGVTAGPHSMYYRVTAISGSGAASGHAFEDLREVEISQDPVDAAFAVPPGEYRFTVAFDRTPPDGNRPGLKQVVSTLVRAANGESSDAFVFSGQLSVPDYADGKLTTSSIILADGIDTLKAPVPLEDQATRPFALGTTEINPAPDTLLTTDQELSVVFLVYNVQQDSDRLPNVTVDYNFYRRDAAGEKFFNRTVPQQFNKATLPSGFDFAAGHQIVAGQSIPLKPFAAGDYRLEIVVKDVIAGTSVTRELRFTVSEP